MQGLGKGSAEIQEPLDGRNLKISCMGYRAPRNEGISRIRSGRKIPKIPSSLTWGGQGFRRLKARPKFHSAVPRDHESSKSINRTLPTWLFGDNGKENGNYYRVRV